jgi:hypothetical protein
MKLASPAALQAAGCEEVAALAALLAEAEPGASVHGARRRIKRLRSLSRLLRDDLGEAAYRRLNDALRQAADALAGQRRAEALGLAAKRLETARTATAFWRPLAEAHQLAHEQQGDPASTRAAARAAIAEAAAILAQAPLAAAGEDAAARAMRKTYGKARKRLRKALASGDAGELHEARKFVIHHLHHLSFLGGGKKRLTQLENLRQLLGDLNDLDELEQLAAQSKATLPDKAAARLGKMRTQLLAACADAARRLFRESPKAFGRRLIVAAAAPEKHR